MEATKKTTKRYIEAVGRRKTATARVRIKEATKNSIVVNDKDSKEYFPTKELQFVIHRPLESSKLVDAHFEITVKTSGGGIHSQADAVAHGISRALVLSDEATKIPLKQAGLLKRDPRAKERRKFGLKKARKAPQWSKR